MSYEVFVKPTAQIGAESTPVALVDPTLYTDALLQVLEWAEAHDAQLYPLVAHEVAALRLQRPLQAWEVRVGGEKVSLLAIREADEQGEPDDA
jgi:hypothetical protein